MSCRLRPVGWSRRTAFPDKESLLEAVVQDRFGRLAQLAVDRMADVQDLSYRQAADTVLRAAVDFFTSEPGLTEVLAPRLAVPPTAPEAPRVIQQVHDLPQAYLTGAAGELSIAALSDPVERERLTTEVVELLLRYAGAG